VAESQQKLEEGPRPLMLVEVPARAQDALRHLVGSWPFGDPLTRLRGIYEARDLLDDLEAVTVWRARNVKKKPISWAQLGRACKSKKHPRGLSGEALRKTHVRETPQEPQP
jgi:hypothetical protein